MNLLTTNAPLVTATRITAYIPHRPPFVLVDTLYYCTETGAVAGYQIRDNPMVDEGLFTEAGMIEHVAQAVALRAGWLGKQPGHPPAFSMGYIAGIKNATIYLQAPVGARLLTELQVKMQFQQMVLIEAVTHCNEQRLLACQLQLFHES